ncbi:T7SS effector LXG polymorphic toxin [Bacillus sp. SA1-12]|uniref:T7SS effector LXG polymorphic toxin n=1 Tax=Bacillus sp. SA1-12 TaxID=1455638 RepID=UPI00069604E1|nr:T7SS effector LXG polymorphic toxin [Bacillus sp. SA1-12]
MVKIVDTKTLIHIMEARSQEYKNLREQMEQVKSKCNEIVNLGEQFQGKGADAIKGFYQAQIDVAEAWLRLIDRQIAFFNGIHGSTEEKDLANSVVHLPFLEDELVHHISNQKEMVASQQDELRSIFNRIDDLISLDAFSTSRFDEQIEQADKVRKATVDAVNQLDEELNLEYRLSEGDEQFVIALFQQLMEASRQGNTISPIQFNLDAYHASEVYKLKGQAEKQTKDYLSFKDEQEAFRAQLKRQEELENRPWYEKAWDGIKTFTGEFTGYYDYIRASEGVDPVTGEKLTAGQRVAAGAMAAAGFIPIVGWAGRIVKGGGAIYKTAKGMHAADQALDVYRTTKTFSNLEKAEMGLYVLVSANGFSEYITGKDMFGNKLTDEQRQASLLQSVVGSSLIAAPFVPQLVKNGKLIREETISKAHELAARTKADLRFVMNEVRGGFHVLRNGMYPNNLAFAANSSVQKVPLNVMKTESVNKVLDGVLAKFSLKFVDKGKQFTNGRRNKLKPNIRYKTGEYDYNYETDNLGRITKFETENLQLTKREERLPHSKKTPGKVKGQDHAGHLAGDRFGGSPKIDNLVSQLSEVNLKRYKKIEDKWAAALKETPPKKVSVDVEIVYNEDEIRPKKFVVNYIIDGDPGFATFNNF